VLCAVSVTLLALLYNSLEILYPLTERNLTAGRQIIQAIFEGFNKETGIENVTYLVPNIIHLFRFKDKNLTFLKAVCVLPALKNHHPDKIIFHNDVGRSLRLRDIARI
jgi:hypothetical protein